MTKIEQKIRDLAALEGWTINEKTITRIAKAKERFFGEEEWHRCPCYPPDDTIHGCGTHACSQDIMTSGICHCSLYMR